MREGKVTKRLFVSGTTEPTGNLTSASKGKLRKVDLSGETFKDSAKGGDAIPCVKNVATAKRESARVVGAGEKNAGAKKPTLKPNNAAAAKVADEYDPDAIMREMLGGKSLTLPDVNFSDDEPCANNIPCDAPPSECCAFSEYLQPRQTAALLVCICQPEKTRARAERCIF